MSPEKIIMLVIAFCFTVWSALFIYRTSFVAIDGKRYFSLFDDAMISMRYGWNFSHGAGLVWNPGEYVEGFTNLLMTLVMSLATLILDKSSAVLAIQALGVALMLGSAFVTVGIAGIITPDGKNQHVSLLKILCFLSVLFYYPLAFWSLMGMETGLLTLLLLLSILYALKYVNEQVPHYLMLTFLWLGLAFLTRNDSAIFAAIIFLFILASTFKSKGTGGHLVWLTGALCFYGLFVLGLLFFQRVYYGDFLPNTYVLKLTGLSYSWRLRDGVGFISPFLAETAFMFTVAGLYLIFEFRKIWLFLAALVVAAIGYQVWVGGDPWPYWRIMSPVMPIVILLFIKALIFFAGSMFGAGGFQKHILRKPGARGSVVFAAAVTILTISGLVITNRSFLDEMWFRSRSYTVENNRQNVNTALALNQLTKDNASIGVLWGGAIPYYSDRYAVDFLGKCDRHIARLAPDITGVVAWNGMISVPGHNKYDLDYSIKTLQPDYVQTYVWGNQNITEWARTRYVDAEYCGVALSLLKDSDAVYWDRVNECRF